MTACQRSAPADRSKRPSARPTEGTIAAVHRLDHLMPDEIRTAIRIARGDLRLAGSVFAAIVLDEPAEGRRARRGNLTKHS